MARHVHEVSREVYFTPESDTFVSSSETERRLDVALARERKIGYMAVSRILSEEFVAQQELIGTPNDIARAHMKQLSIPLHELHAARARNAEPEEDVIQEANGVYKKASGVIGMFVEERDALGRSSEFRVRHGEITGAISELAIFALLARSHHQNGYAAFPSSRYDDHAPKDVTGKRHSFDFVIANERTPSFSAGVQVKTSSEHLGPRYAQSVPLISLQEIADGSYYDGKYSLPRAIVRDADGHASNQDTARITSATRALNAKLAAIENTRS